MIDHLATELTSTPRGHARNILANFIHKVSGSLEENVIEVCKNLVNALIKKINVICIVV